MLSQLVQCGQSHTQVLQNSQEGVFLVHLTRKKSHSLVICYRENFRFNKSTGHSGLIFVAQEKYAEKKKLTN